MFFLHFFRLFNLNDSTMMIGCFVLAGGMPEA